MEAILGWGVGSWALPVPSAHMKKIERSQIDNLMMYLEALEKEEKTTSRNKKKKKVERDNKTQG